MGAECLFMDDKARPHRANIVDECLQSVDITRMDWPAYSPGLNPIEHMWDMLGRGIAARQPRRKDTASQQNTSWPSGVMVWMGMPSQGLPKPFFVDPEANIEAKYYNNKILKHLTKETEMSLP
ncbi:transposable element Tcb1 transposase [Trichonephila clavipes]|nr:transposable element Tcb1 transposase [Trichonephila clavipes]